MLDLIRFSPRDVIHCVAIPFTGSLQERLTEKNIPYFISKQPLHISPVSLARLLRYIRKHHADIVHTHGFRANLYGRISALLTGRKHVATMHVSLYDYIDTPGWRRYIYILIERLMSVITARFICVSLEMAADAHKMGIPRQKIIHIPNGIDMGRFSGDIDTVRVRRELHIAKNENVIGTVGRMVTEKGQIYLLEALEHLKSKWPDLKCVLIGEGPLQPSLKHYARKARINEMCIFLAPRNDIEAIYSIFDIFVLPSIREPFGLVALEAMAAGVPVIATDAGGPKDYIHSGYNGILVPSENAQALAGQINRLLSDASLCETLVAEGIKTVKEYYSIEKTTELICQVYRQLIFPADDVRAKSVR